VGLARAAVAERDHVLPPLDVIPAREVEHQDLVERGDGQEIEAVQAFDRGEARLADAALHHPPLALDQFQFGQAQEIADVVHALGRALPRHLVVLTDKGRQLECLQMMGGQQAGCVTHRRSAPSSAV
jgi:hypothetical protein